MMIRRIITQIARKHIFDGGGGAGYVGRNVFFVKRNKG